MAVDPDIVKLSESIMQAAFATIGAILESSNTITAPAFNTITAPAFGMLLSMSTLHAAHRLPWPLMTLRVWLCLCARCWACSCSFKFVRNLNPQLGLRLLNAMGC